MSDPLYYPWGETLPAPGETIEVVAGLHWLRMPLPFALNHINLWLLRDAAGWTAVDGGYDMPETRTLWTRHLRNTLAGGILRDIVVTHYHPDHIGLADWLAHAAAVEGHPIPVWMSAPEMLGAKAVWHDLPGHDTAALVAHFRAHGLPETRAAQLEARGNTYRHGVPSLPVTYRRLLPDEVRTFGGRVWRCLAGYGHSPEHLALYCAEDALLIAGDMLLPKISTNVGVWASEPDGDPLAQFLASLDVLATLPDDTLILPSHGRPFRGAAARVAALKAHHAERLAAIEAACGSPMSAYDMVPVLFGRVFDLYQTFFALAESVAHLNHLWHRGRLARVAGRDGVWRFVRV